MGSSRVMTNLGQLSRIYSSGRYLRSSVARSFMTVIATYTQAYSTSGDRRTKSHSSFPMRPTLTSYPNLRA